MADLTEKQQQKLRVRDITTADFAEIVRESETVLDVQQKTRIDRYQVRPIITKLGLEDEVKTGGTLLREQDTAENLGE
jgi:polyhydroxyalkanoate synthesis regulator protein